MYCRTIKVNVKIALEGPIKYSMSRYTFLPIVSYCTDLQVAVTLQETAVHQQRQGTRRLPTGNMDVNNAVEAFSTLHMAPLSVQT